MVAPLPPPPRARAPRSATPAAPWVLRRYGVVGSTNDIASRAPAWTAVLARRQLRGRGRHGRHWVSDEGGLWLSAVLPTPGLAATWAVLPLAAGWALREALADLGVLGLHLRWPNDVMIGPAKLAGLLVERHRPETAVVGLGLNLTNDPAAHDPDLAGQVVRLADLLPDVPPVEAIAARILARLAVAQRSLAERRIQDLLPTLNAAWTTGLVSVQLHQRAEPVTGRFVGVDARGQLDLELPNHDHLVVSPLQVERLRELDPSS
jgi:BirA family transcriptional regulator, biotin operon repressor / biotin---[acetyl-CoA-carboxylase] ligase